MSQNESIWQRIRTSWFGASPTAAPAVPGPRSEDRATTDSPAALSLPGIPRVDDRSARLSEDRAAATPLHTPLPPPLPPARRPAATQESTDSLQAAGPMPGPRVAEAPEFATAAPPAHFSPPTPEASSATIVARVPLDERSPSAPASSPSPAPMSVPAPATTPAPIGSPTLMVESSIEAAQTLRDARSEFPPAAGVSEFPASPLPPRRPAVIDEFVPPPRDARPPAAETRLPAARSEPVRVADQVDRPSSSALRTETLMSAAPAGAAASRTEAAVAQLQDGYSRLLRMMGKMEEYFDSNEQRAEHMSRSVERFASTLDRLAETQHTQGESMRAIANSAERTGNLTVQLTEGVGALAESADRNGRLALQVSDSMSALAASADRSGHLSLQMSETLAQLPASFQQVSETLRAVMERVGADQKQIVERLESGQLALVSRLDAAQNGALQRYESAQVTLGEQVDVLRDSQTALVQTLDRFGTAIEELTTASRANAETFKRIGLSEMEQRHMMTRLVGKLARRVTILVGVLGGLMLAGLAMMIFLMMMSLDRPAS